MPADRTTPPSPARLETRTPPASAALAVAALAADLLLVTLFTALGQGQHATAGGLGRLLLTASPFLLALLLMTALTAGHRTWDRVWPQGVAVWLGTVAIGMALRVLWDLGGAPLPFVIVATLVLGVFLLGRRALTRMLTARRRARA